MTLTPRQHDETELRFARRLFVETQMAFAQEVRHSAILSLPIVVWEQDFNAMGHDEQAHWLRMLSLEREAANEATQRLFRSDSDLTVITDDHGTIKTTGQLLRSTREDKGIGLNELARDLSISQGYLSKVERDMENPSRELLERLAAKLGIDSDHLVLSAGFIPADVERYILSRHSFVKHVRAVMIANPLPAEDMPL